MKKLWERLQNYFYTQSTNESIYFTKFAQTIIDENKWFLHMGFIVVPIVYMLLVAISYIAQKSVDNILSLLVFIPAMAIYFFYYNYAVKALPEDRVDPNYECLLYFTICLCQFIILDTAAFAHSEGLWFHSLLILLALIYTAQFREYLIIYTTLSTLYIVLLFSVKHPAFIAKDLFNLVLGYILSVFTARIICNIRNAKAKQNQILREESSYDKLTGLLNKGVAKREIEAYFASRSPRENVVVISIDADNFKQINDKLGHTAGDVVLSNIGKILKNSFRIDDIVARNGGDEFLVVMKGVVPPFHIDTICRRIQMSVASIIVEGGWNFTCSLGVVIDTHNFDFDSIFEMADDALYECKIRGRDCFSEWYTYNFSFPDDKPLILMSAAAGHPQIHEVKDALTDKYSILFAENGNEVLNLTSQYHNRLALVMLDMELLKIPASQVLSYLKQRPNFSHIPVLALSPDGELFGDVKESTADAVLSVPCDNSDILNKLEELIAR